jgi:hypothetical protein
MVINQQVEQYLTIECCLLKSLRFSHWVGMESWFFFFFFFNQPFQKIFHHEIDGSEIVPQEVRLKQKFLTDF